MTASNRGGDHHPAWQSNLLADPTVKLTSRDRTGPYVGHETTDDERAADWDRGPNQATASSPTSSEQTVRSRIVVRTPAN